MINSLRKADNFFFFFTLTFDADVECTKPGYYVCIIFLCRSKASVAFFIFAVLNEAAEKLWRKPVEQTDVSKCFYTQVRRNGSTRAKPTEPKWDLCSALQGFPPQSAELWLGSQQHWISGKHRRCIRMTCKRHSASVFLYACACFLLSHSWQSPGWTFCHNPSNPSCFELWTPRLLFSPGLETPPLNQPVTHMHICIQCTLATPYGWPSVSVYLPSGSSCP